MNLSKEIKKGLDILGYKNLTDVQKEVIPKLLNYQNIIVKSKTGSGKTASFSIPICENIEINNKIQALIIVPTRELSMQVSSEISSVGRIKKVRCEAIFGKAKIKEQIHTLKQRVQVVVATPGRLIDLLKREEITLENLKYLIIDEADKMLNKGFVDDMKFLFDNINREITVGLFSATIDENVKKFSDEFIKNYEIINLEDKYLDCNFNENYKEIKFNNSEINSIENITEKNLDNKLNKLIKEYLVKSKDKYQTLKEIIYNFNPESIIIFCNTKEKVSSIYRKLRNDNFYVRELSGDMSQEKRIFALDDFKNKKFNVLVCTDVASRGIHIDKVSLVINFDIPKDIENYVHRIGRTGRYKSQGIAVSIFEEKDEKYISEIENYINKKLEIYDLQNNKELLNKNKKDFFEKSKKIINNSFKIQKENYNKNEEITKIYLNCGKNKKIRNLDILGALNNIEGIENSDIGVIEIKDDCSYVDILNYKGNVILKNKEIIIKRKTVKIRKNKKIL